MKVIEKNNSIILENFADEFHLKNTLDSGQAFRFTQCDDTNHTWEGIVCSTHIYLKKEANNIVLWPCDMQIYQEKFAHYFDLSRDYKKIKKQIAIDDYMRCSLQYVKGLRILKQPPFETVISFIISANNNIKRIRKVIETIAIKCGTPIENGYAFPSEKQLATLSENELRECGAGYRAKYIVESTKMICDGFDLEALKELPYLEAKKEIQKLPGVGPKVADCILLFALDHDEAFPVDTWVKKVLEQLYVGQNYDDVTAKYGVHAGYAQQILFHHVRSVGIETFLKQQKDYAKRP